MYRYTYLWCPNFYNSVDFKKSITRVLHLVKVARSGFCATIPLNFEQLAYHSEQPNRKSIVTADLEKDESFKW